MIHLVLRHLAQMWFHTWMRKDMRCVQSWWHDTLKTELLFGYQQYLDPFVSLLDLNSFSFLSRLQMLPFDFNQ